MQPLQTTPERYTLPMFLLEAPVAAAEGRVPLEVSKHGEKAKVAAEKVREAIARGIEEFSVQRKPLVIMSKDWYRKALREPMGHWALVFLHEYLQKEWETKSEDDDDDVDGDNIEEDQALWSEWWRVNMGFIMRYIGAEGSSEDQHEAANTVKTWGLSDHSVQ
eukprot:4302077-Pyramimonas_sp.AAC.1